MRINQILSELSTELLARYKKAAYADAKKADSEGDYKRGDKRFKGINKATVKQFDNDLKKHGQQSVAEDAEVDEKTLRQRYPHYYKLKDEGAIFRVQKRDGTTRDLTPDNWEWDIYYKETFPDKGHPDDAKQPDGQWYHGDNPLVEQTSIEEAMDAIGEWLAEEGKASRALCQGGKPDSELGASQLASCKSQGLRARDGEKSHLIGHAGSKVRIKVGGKKIKGKKYGGPLPDYGTRKGQR